jgi:SAM-dependent methyltransferase
MSSETRLRRHARKTVRKLEEGFDQLVYDRRFGIDTGGIVVLSGHDDESRPYQAVQRRLLTKVLRSVELEPTDVFLDAGCGKGRAVLHAANVYPFARSVGFDFAPELIEVAQDNLSKVRDRLKCKEVEFIVADAAKWPIPADISVILANNPFQGELLKRFVEQVLASFERRPRRLRLIYMNAFEPEAIESTGAFELVAVPPWRGPSVRIYEVAKH